MVKVKYAAFILLIMLLPSNSLASSNTVLNQVYRYWDSNNTDHYTSINPYESTGIDEGQIFYLMNSTVPGTLSLHSLYNGASVDHMVSQTTNESGYSYIQTIGSAYAYSLPGLYPIKRWLNPIAEDHIVNFSQEIPSGYIEEGVIGYGYPRYGTLGEVRYECLTSDNTIYAEGDIVSISVNLVAGGAVCELNWKGKQFINNYDYGRQIQTAFNFDSLGLDNPTEAGSRYGYPEMLDCPEGVKCSTSTLGREGKNAQGSPLISINVTGTTLTTETRPLQWNPDEHNGGEFNPVAWDGTVEKEVILDYDTNYTAHVIKWTTTINVPNDEDYFDWELITAYLNPEFNKLYAFDAVGNQLYDKTNIVLSQNGEMLAPPAANMAPMSGGVINATADGQYALGVFRTKTDYYNHFALGTFLGFNSISGEYGRNTTKWSVMERDASSGISAGAHSGTAYLLVGTLSNVVQTMRSMYIDGY